MLRLRFISLSILSLTLLTGCWDIKEIEDVGIVTGLGLDVSEENDSLTMTNQYVVPGKIPTQQDTSSKGVPFQNITLEGDTFFEIIRENSLESNRPPNYTHLKSILTSRRLLEKERADQGIDLFIRDHEFRRTVPVFVTKDSVEDIFNTEPVKEMFPAIQIKELSENYAKINTNPNNLSIGDMSQYISENKSFLIPGIALKNGHMTLSGAGIISSEDFKYAGWIESKDIEGIRYIQNHVKGGFIDLKKDKINNGPIVLEIKASKTKYNTELNGDTLQVEVLINISTVLAEDWGTERNVYKKGWKGSIEKAASDDIKEKVEAVIKLAQQEYGIDFLDIAKWVDIHEPAYYKSHEKNWNESFQNLQFRVKVETEITDFGTQNFNTE